MMMMSNTKMTVKTYAVAVACSVAVFRTFISGASAVSPAQPLPAPFAFISHNRDCCNHHHLHQQQQPGRERPRHGTCTFPLSIMREGLRMTVVVQSSMRPGDVGDWDNDDFLASLSRGDDDDDIESPKSPGSLPPPAQDVAVHSSTVPPPPSPQQYYPPPPPGYYYDPQRNQWLYDANLAQQQQQQAPPPPPSPPPGQQQSQYQNSPGPTGGSGRVRPKDKIANTSDLYLEQLKMDTATRKRAFLSGDYDASNEVWTDERIQKVKEEYEPALSGAARKQSDYLLTAPEEMLPSPEALKMLEDEKMKEEEAKSFTGVSYRERMDQRKKGGKKTRGITSDTEEKQQQDVTELKVVKDQSPPVAADIPTMTRSPASASRTAEESNVTSNAEVHSPQAVASPTPPFASVDDSPVATPVDTATTTAGTTAPFEAKSEDETRRLIRTLMGLILKHRGGAGFGSGRLKNPMEIQRFEKTLAEVLQILRHESGSPVVDADIVPAVATNSASTALKSEPSLLTMLSCVKAAIGTYEEVVTEEEKHDLLPHVRDAMMHAIESCNDALASDIPAETRSSAVAEPTTESKTTLDFPSPGQYAVTELVPQEEEEQADDQAEDIFAASPTSDGSNHAILEKAYNVLKGVKGDKKFGLKSSISSPEAEDLTGNLIEMRRVLMEELEEGVISEARPSSSSTTTTAVTPLAEEEKREFEPKLAYGGAKLAEVADTHDHETSSSSGGSKYAEMLRRAKKAKEATKNTGEM